jgi:hypothetical protein
MLGFIRAGRAGLSRAAGQNLANVRPVVSIRTQEIVDLYSKDYLKITSATDFLQ